MEKKNNRLSQTVRVYSRKRRRTNNEKEEELRKPPMPDLPADIMVEIFSRLDLVDILGHAQRVSRYWRQIAKEPRIFRTIRLPCSNPAAVKSKQQLTQKDRIELLRDAVKRSDEQVTKISLASCKKELAKELAKACKKFPLLEELEFTDTVADSCSKFLCCTVVEPIGKSCKQLKYFRVFGKDPPKMEQSSEYRENLVNAIAENMPNLRGLRLYLTNLTEEGLQDILDGCPHLEELDLQDCCFAYDDMEYDLLQVCQLRNIDLTLPSGAVVPEYIPMGSQGC